MRSARGPNTALMAAVSTASLASVPVPCALIASTSAAATPAESSAACIAAVCPSTLGRVMWATSVVRP